MAAPQVFEIGSYGNGAAMRAAPIGGFFGCDPARAAAEAQLAAGRDLVGRELIRETLPYVPAGETSVPIAMSLDIPAEEIETAVRVPGAGWQVSAQDAVPFCLWCAAHSLFDFEGAMWRTVAGMGDRDTTCAIEGGMVVLSSRQVPTAWVAHHEPLSRGCQRA
jgi:ADP-ribosylglycohydrolase